MELNYAILNRKNPWLYQKLLHTGTNLEVVPCADGRYTLRLQDLQGKGFTINSKYDLEQDIKRITKDIDYTPSLLVWFGIGMGHEIKRVFKQKDQAMRLVIIEPRLDILKTALYHTDLSELLLSDEVYLFAGNSEEIEQQLKDEENNALVLFVKTIWKHFHPYCRRVYDSSEIESIWWKFYASIMRKYYTLGNCIDDTLLGINHLFSNLEYTYPSPVLSKLGDLYKNYPAICVASGPSLDKNIDVLKKIQHQALIFCADSVWEKLMNHGIIPDGVSALERTKHVYRMFFNHKSHKLSEKTCLIGQSVIYPLIFKQYPYQKIICSKSEIPIELTLGTFLPSLNNYHTGMSCAHTSFGIAKVLGCNPMILVGQDLAYGENGFSHAKGTWGEEKTEVDFPEQSYPVENIHRNGTVMTDDLYDAFRKWFEDDIAREPQYTYINATEGGAYIHGADVMTLSEVADHYINHLPTKKYLADVIQDKNLYLSNEEIEDMRHRLQGYLLEQKSTIIQMLQDLEKVSEKFEDNEQLIAQIVEFEENNRIVIDAINQLKNIIDEIYKLSNELYDMEIYFLVQYLVVEYKQLVTARRHITSLEALTDLQHALRSITQQLQDALNKVIYEYERGIDIIKKGKCDNIDTPLMGEMYEE